MSDNLRDKLLQREPLLPFIEEAIDRHRRGIKEPVLNPADGRMFLVEFDEALATLKVLLGGRVVYRSRHAKSGDREQQAS